MHCARCFSPVSWGSNLHLASKRVGWQLRIRRRSGKIPVSRSHLQAGPTKSGEAKKVRDVRTWSGRAAAAVYVHPGVSAPSAAPVLRLEPQRLGIGMC